MKTEKRIFNIMHKESKITNTSLLTKSSMFMLLGAYQCAVKKKTKGSLGIPSVSKKHVLRCMYTKTL